MGKIKTATKLLKLNNQLGLLDIGDIVGLASTAYKVKNFSPTDYLPDWEIFEKEEYERAQTRKTILTAAAVAGGAYLIYKNRDAIAKAADEARVKTSRLANEAEDKAYALASDVSDKVDEVSDKASELKDDTERKAQEVAEDVSDKGHDLAADAAKKGSEIADKVADKADDASDKLEKSEKEIKKDK